MPPIEAVRWSPDGAAARIIDQTRLPAELVERDLRTVDEVVAAIRSLAVRGAPAIGVAGAIGLVASLLPHAAEPPGDFDRRAARHAGLVGAARPTAVNLSWAVRRVIREAEKKNLKISAFGQAVASSPLFTMGRVTEQTTTVAP